MFQSINEIGPFFNQFYDKQKSKSYVKEKLA